MDTIISSKRQELSRLESLSVLEEHASNYGRTPIIPQWDDKTVDVIAEIKRSSPSKGDLADIKDPANLARMYSSAGAVAISVLTDHTHFGAHKEDFQSVRNAVDIALLRKDFIIDVRQVYETYLMGADIMLLIVAAFQDYEFMLSLYDTAIHLGLSVLVEAHTQDDLDKALLLGSNLIGVNVRDLSTFEEKPEVGASLIKEIPADVTKVWESAIRSLDDVQIAKEAGADAVLMGQALVQSTDPGSFIEHIRAL